MRIARLALVGAVLSSSSAMARNLDEDQRDELRGNYMHQQWASLCVMLKDSGVDESVVQGWKDYNRRWDGVDPAVLDEQWESAKQQTAGEYAVLLEMPSTLIGTCRVVVDQLDKKTKEAAQNQTMGLGVALAKQLIGERE